MDKIQAIYQVTKKLYNQLQQPFPLEDREPYIEKVEQLLLERANLLEGFTFNPNQMDDQQKKLLVAYNQEIDRKLKSVLAVISGDINKLKEKKMTNRKYEIPEDSYYTDGIFFDKKN